MATPQELSGLNQLALQKNVSIDYSSIASGVINVRDANGNIVKSVSTQATPRDLATHLQNMSNSTNLAVVGASIVNQQNTVSGDGTTIMPIIAGGGTLSPSSTGKSGTRTFTFRFSENTQTDDRAIVLGDILGYNAAAKAYSADSLLYPDKYTDVNNSVTRDTTAYFNVFGTATPGAQSFMNFLGGVYSGGFTVTKITVTQADSAVNATLLNDVKMARAANPSKFESITDFVNIQPTLQQTQFQQSVSVLQDNTGGLTVGVNSALIITIPAGYKAFSIAFEIAPSPIFDKLYSVK